MKGSKSACVDDALVSISSAAERAGKELDIIDKIVYKSRNQHRRGDYFRSMMRARTLSRKALGKVSQKRVGAAREYFEETMAMCLRARDAMELTASQLGSLISAGYFLPFAVAAQATTCVVAACLSHILALFEEEKARRFYC